VHDSWVKENSILIKKQQQGYHVIGVHGYSSQFYRRNIIWPVLGVQEMFFDDEFAKLFMPVCGDNSFRGVCDTAIDTWLFNRISLQPQRKEFYYWVTLNTHLPLGEIHDEAYKQFAEKWSKEGIAENVLKLAWKHYAFFTHVAAQLARLPAPHLHMLLVGDHAPPFVDPAERSMYDEKYVPYVEIKGY
jgi:phosphoglycerol transferase MdoB-like AlkP superfamily enzyme